MLYLISTNLDHVMIKKLFKQSLYAFLDEINIRVNRLK